MARALALCVLGFVIAAGAVARAANEFDVYDAPHPGGSLQSQHDTLSAAIAAASSGDEIRISTSGSPYYQHAATAGKDNISIREEPGGGRPVISGAYQPYTSVPNSLWTDQGGNVYTADIPSNSVPFRFLGYMNGKRLFSQPSQAAFDASTLPSIFYDGVADVVYIRTDGSDPNSVAVFVASKVSGRDVVLDIDDSDGITVSGLEFKHGGIASVRVDDSTNVLVQDVIVRDAGVSGVVVTGTTSANVTLRGVRAFNDYVPEWRFEAGQDGIKSNVHMDGSAFDFKVLSGFLMEFCYAEEWFNGVNSQSDVTGFNDGSVIRRSHFVNINDDALELDGRCDACEVYENFVVDTFTGVSMSPKWGESSADTTLIYRNRIYATKTVRLNVGTVDDGKGFKVGSQIDASRGSVDHPSNWARIYHNEVVADGEVFRATYGTGTIPPSNFQVYNNVFTSTRGPLLRNVGSAANGNFWNGNLYSQLQPGQWYRDHYDGTSDFNVLPRKQVADATGGWDVGSEEARPDGRRLNQGVTLPDGWTDTVTPVGKPDRGAIEKTAGVGITSIWPTGGAGGDRVHVVGAYFDETVSITVDGTALQNAVFVSNNYIYGTLASGSGTVDVVATKGGQSATLEDGFTYE